MHRHDWIRSKVNLEDTILEVGCAENPVWNGTPFKVTTMDKSIRPEEQCFPDVVGQAENLPFEEQSFDVVCADELLEHIPDPQKVLKEAIRVARKKVICTVPNEFAWPKELKPFWNPGHVRFYNKKTFTEELDRLGLPFLVEDIIHSPWAWLGAEVYCDQEKFVATEMVKLNLGSFRDTIGYDWTNIDILPIQQYIIASHKFRQWDLRRGIPYPDNSVDLIRMSHLIEHLTLEEAKNLLKEVYRTLKPSGVARISTPDAKIIIRHYQSQDMSFFNQIQPPEYIQAPTEGERLSRLLFSGDYSHKAVYDFGMLQNFLENAGFQPNKIYRVSPGFSNSDVMRIETEDQHVEISLTAEAIK